MKRLKIPATLYILGRAPNFYPSLLQGLPDCCNVTVRLVEKSVLGLRVGTYLQGTRGSCVFRSSHATP